MPDDCGVRDKQQDNDKQKARKQKSYNKRTANEQLASTRIPNFTNSPNFTISQCHQRTANEQLLHGFQPSQVHQFTNSPNFTNFTMSPNHRPQTGHRSQTTRLGNPSQRRNQKCTFDSVAPHCTTFHHELEPNTPCMYSLHLHLHLHQHFSPRWMSGHGSLGWYELKPVAQFSFEQRFDFGRRHACRVQILEQDGAVVGTLRVVVVLLVVVRI